MSTQLFVIKRDEDDDNDIYALYTDLESAKNELKNIYNKIPDYKHYGYQIIVYNLIGKEYIITNITYNYKFDIFSENISNDARRKL